MKDEPLPRAMDADDWEAEAGKFDEPDEGPLAGEEFMTGQEPPRDDDSRRSQRKKPEIKPLAHVRVADVKTERVAWGWSRRMPFGKLTILDGDPGLGKSTVLLNAVARWTRGESLPGETVGREPFNVVIIAAEDGIGDTIRPRLEVAGADLGRVYATTGLPTFPADLPGLAATVRETSAKAVLLDPGLAFLDPELNAHADAEVRRMVVGLSDVAASTGALAVFVRHLNKAAGSNALYRGGGSIAIVATARSALLVAPDPQDPGRRVLVVVKANLCAAPPTLLFRVVADDAEAPAGIVWEGESSVTAGEALSAMSDQRREAAGKKAIAVDLLGDLLRGGPRPVEEIEAAVRAAKVDMSASPLDSRAIRAARKALKIESFKSGWREWSWRLPTPRHEGGHEVGE